MKKIEEPISGSDILPSLVDVKISLDFSSVNISESEKNQKTTFLQSLISERFRNIEELSKFIYKFLPSKRISFNDRICENIENYLIYRSFLEIIEEKKSEKKYSALNSFKEAKSLGEAVKLYNTRNEWGNLFREHSGNFLRSLSMSYLSVEPINILRIFRRTIDGLNPFNGEKIGKEININIRKKLISVVYCLLRFFNKDKNNNPALLFVLYLMKYGFKQSKEFIGVKCFFDEIYCEGLARYLFVHKKIEFNNDKKFVELCFKNEKKTKDIITFEDITFNCNNLKYSEVTKLRENFFMKNEDDDLTIEEICRKKEELLREEKKRKIFLKCFSDLTDEMNQTFDLENSFEMMDPPTPVTVLNQSLQKDNLDSPSENENEDNDLKLYSMKIEDSVKKNKVTGTTKKENDNDNPQVISIDLHSVGNNDTSNEKIVDISEFDEDEPKHTMIDIKNIQVDKVEESVLCENLNSIEEKKEIKKNNEKENLEKTNENQVLEENKNIENEEMKEDSKDTLDLGKSFNDLTKALSISTKNEIINVESEISLSPLDSIFGEDDPEIEKEMEKIEQKEMISKEKEENSPNSFFIKTEETKEDFSKTIQEDWVNPEKLPDFIRSKINTDENNFEKENENESDDFKNEEINKEIQKMIKSLKRKEEKKKGWIKPIEVNYPQKLTTSEYGEID